MQIKNLPPKELGQLLLVGWSGKSAPRLPMKWLGANRIGGIIHFKRNLAGLREIAALNRKLLRHFPDLWIAVDQEGGRVQRLRKPFLELPPALRMGNCCSLQELRLLGHALGRQLRALGFNLDFAPVLDVNSNPDNPIIGDRAFSDDPVKAARRALSFAAGLHNAGVLSCGKHFPGHGDTRQDSHLELPVIAKSPAALKRVELKPFVAAVRARIPMIMTAHVKYSALDRRFPATLSPRILRDLLRRGMGFRGVIISDDLEMRGIAAHYPVRKMVERGVLAGVDVFLVCKKRTMQQQVLQELRRLWRASPGHRKLLAQSLLRVSNLKINPALHRPRKKSVRLKNVQGEILARRARKILTRISRQS